MLENVDIQYVLGHGANSADLFFVVPENTFVYYVGKSGYVESMGAARKMAAFKPETLYEDFFTAKEPKYLQTYPGAHVYVPGDILPMSELLFRHFAPELPTTTLPTGVYRKPFSAELESYYTNVGSVAVFHYADIDTMARIYPPVRSVEFRDDLMTPAADAPDQVTPRSRRVLYDDMVSRNDQNPMTHVNLRYAFLKAVSTWYGIPLLDLLKPDFWFKNPEVMYEYTVAKQFHIDGNLLLPSHPEYLNQLVDMERLLYEVPSAKPYRLLILTVCRALPIAHEHEGELTRLAQRLSSASKEEAVQCVTSERRNPVFNLAAVKAAYERMFPLYSRMRVALRDNPKLAEVWRIQNHLFTTTGFARLDYNPRLPVEVLYDAMKIIRPDDALIDRIPNEEARDAFRDVVEAIHAAFNPVVQRIEREFASQNRRSAPSTKFLKYTTRRTTRYKKGTPTRKGNATGNRV